MLARFILLLAAFLSGAAALGFEVVWVRMLGQVLGHTVGAVSAVLAAFFFGLGIGSLIASRLASRLRSPLMGYVLVEILIAVVGLSMPSLIRFSEELLFEGVAGGGAPGVAPWLRFGFAFSLLVVPTVLMGATLPFLSEILVRDRLELGDVSGFLYAVSTFGAVCGTLAAGFFLIESVGLHMTSQIAAAASGVSALAAGAIALFASSKRSLGSESTEHRREELSRFDVVGWWMLFVIGASGFFALSYEVLWTRLLGMFLANSSYSFTLILATVLFGSAVGSLVLSRFVDRIRWPALLLGLSQVVLGFFAVFSLRLVQSIDQQGSLRLHGPIGNAVTRWLGGESYGAMVAVELLGIFSMFLLPAVVMGMTFPLAVRLAGGSSAKDERSNTDHGAGRTVGRVLCANTLLGLVGPPVTVFFLLPTCGAGGALLLLGAAQAFIGSVVIAVRAEIPAFARRMLGTIVFVGVSVLILEMPRDLKVWKSPEDTELVAYREGAAATIAVVLDREGRPRLKTNNTYSLGGGEGTLIEARQGHLAALVGPGSIERALVIGMGTGNAARALSRHPIGSLTVVEIVPGVIEMASFFSPQGDEPLSQEHVSLVIQDGREVILRSSATFDLVVGDLFFPWRAGISDLYSREHFQRIRGRLSSRGVFCQWLPLHQLSSDGLGIVVRTFVEVFPEATMWIAYYNANDPIACLVGGLRPLSLDYNALWVKLREEKVRPHLLAVGLAEPEDVLGLYVTDASGLLEQFGDPGTAPRITTDDRPVLEFRATRDSILSRQFGLENLRTILLLRHPSGPDVSSVDKVLEARLGRAYRSAGKILEGQAFEIEGRTDPRARVAPAYQAMYTQKSLDMYYEALALAPEYPYALAVVKARIDHAMGGGRFDEAINILEEVVDRIDPPAEILGRLGVALVLAGEPREALEPLRRCVRLDDGAVTARIYLGKALLQEKEFDEAARHLEKAKKQAPEHRLLHGPLGELYFLTGREEEGKAALRRAVAVDPADARARALLEGEE